MDKSIIPKQNRVKPLPLSTIYRYLYAELNYFHQQLFQKETLFNQPSRYYIDNSNATVFFETLNQRILKNQRLNRVDINDTLNFLKINTSLYMYQRCYNNYYRAVFLGAVCRELSMNNRDYSLSCDRIDSIRLEYIAGEGKSGLIDGRARKVKNFEFYNYLSKGLILMDSIKQTTIWNRFYLP